MFVVRLNNISKRYRLYDKPHHKLKEAMIRSIFRSPRAYHREFWALKDINLEISKGKTLGIIGLNGSGKSTLLQIIAGILQPTTGNIQVKGRVSALLELGAGFNPEFTGRENVYMNGQIMGLSRKEMEKNLESILEFADIGEFIDQPVKIYSSGMYVRLAFATAISVDPEILIIDEALSVGDVFFQQKCFNRIREIQNKGTTCLFCSHDTTAVQNLCDQAILLEHGQIEFLGDPEEVVSRYFARIGKHAASRAPQKVETTPISTKLNDMITTEEIFAHNIIRNGKSRHGARGLEIVAARVTDKKGNDTLQVEMMGTLIFHILLCAKENILEPSSGIHLYDRLGNIVFATGTKQLKQRLPDLASGQELVVKMEITFNVQQGEYTFSLGAAEPSSEGPNVGYLHDRHEMLGPIIVIADPREVLPFYGIAQLPTTITFALIKSFSHSTLMK